MAPILWFGLVLLVGGAALYGLRRLDLETQPRRSGPRQVEWVPWTIGVGAGLCLASAGLFALTGSGGRAGGCLVVGLGLLVVLRVVLDVGSTRDTRTYQKVHEETGNDSLSFLVAALPVILFLGTRALGFSNTSPVALLALVAASGVAAFVIFRARRRASE